MKKVASVVKKDILVKLLDLNISIAKGNDELENIVKAELRRARLATK
jgi:hypothetical protein